MSEIQRYDWNTGARSPTGQHVRYAEHIAEVERLQKQVRLLREALDSTDFWDESDDETEPRP